MHMNEPRRVDEKALANAGPVDSTCLGPAREGSSRLERIDILDAASAAAYLPPSTVRTKAGTAKCVPKPVAKPVVRPVHPPDFADELERPLKARRSKHQSASGAQELKPKRKPRTRRLPVEGELTLVPWSPDRGPPQETDGSAHHGHTSDPIVELSSQSHHHGIAPFDDADNGVHNKQGSRAPLTAIRKRLKTSTLTHKIMKPRRAEEALSGFCNRKKVAMVGDGFDASELYINVRVVSHRRPKPK